MEATASTMERIDETALKESVRAEMQRLGMSQTRLSKESGINQARLSQWFSGKYPGNTEVVAQELTRWLNSVQARTKDTSRLSVTPDWKPTPTANNIVTALRYAQNAGDIALVYGGAGLGKTCTAKRYQEDNPNVWIATMTPAMNTVAAALERIAFSVGLPEAQPSAVKTENAIVARLEDTGGLLIVDEAQHLPVAGLDAVRSIHDATGIGLALMGNEQVYARITGGARQAHFAQLFSRVGYRVKLAAPSVGDVETIIAAWGVRESKAQTLCIDIAKQAGALRGLTKVLRLAHMMLAEGEAILSFDHIQTAWADLGGNL
jgi:DNA transposition AAA+ family ATPase